MQILLFAKTCFITFTSFSFEYFLAKVLSIKKYSEHNIIPILDYQIQAVPFVQVTVGTGLPVTLHSNVFVEPSFTDKSENGKWSGLPFFGYLRNT